MGLRLWGTCASLNAVVAIQKSKIQHLLPEDLTFCEQTITPEGTHPIIFQANTQHIRIFTSCFRMNYFEMIPLIPLVAFKDKPSEYFQAAPILYVSNRWIVLGADTMWHLNKVYAKFRLSNKVGAMEQGQLLSQEVFRKDTDAISIDFRSAGNTILPNDLPHFKTIEPLFNHDALIWNDSRKYWKAPYSVKVKEVQPCTATIQVKNIQGLPSETFTSGSIADSPIGAYRLQFSWNLLRPQSIPR